MKKNEREIFKNSSGAGIRDDELLNDQVDLDTVFEELEGESLDFSEYEIEEEEDSAPAKPKKEKKKKKGFFSKKEKKRDEMEDLYYGVEFKPLNELKKGYTKSAENNQMSNTYVDLFDNTLDLEAEESFNKIKEERRKRVAHAVETAGVNEEELADEFGVVAPMPVTSFAADPYTKQHGISGLDEADEFQKAMNQSAENETIEIKLNVLNDTIELQKSVQFPKVDEQEIEKFVVEKSVSNPVTQSVPDMPEVKSEEKAMPQATQVAKEEIFPLLDDITRYRPKLAPVHAVKADLLQNAIDKEAQIYQEVKAPVVKRAYNRKEVPVQNTEEESIDDYAEQSEAKSIFSSLKKDLNKLSLKILVSAISTILLFILSIGFESGAQTADPNSNPNAYLIINILVLCANIWMFKSSLIDGFKNLFAYKPDSDSAVSFAVFAALLQNIVAFIYPAQIAGATSHLYNLLVMFALLTNAIGKHIMSNRIYRNFRFITSREQKYVIKNYEGEFADIKNGKVVHQKKVKFLKNFLQYSYGTDPAERVSKKLAPLGVIASLALFITVLVLTRDTFLGFTAFAASASIWVCFTNLITVNLPLSKLTKTTLRSGAMASGYEAVKQMAAVNTIVIDESGIFPNGTVTIDGINTFEYESADEALFIASGVAREAGGTLSDIFAQIANEYPEDFPNPSAISYEDEKGVSAVVDGRRVLIGNRELLTQRNIQVPENAEDEYIANGNQVIFVAFESDLAAMLILSYKFDSRRQSRLKNLEKSGVSIAIKTTNPNLTPEFISTNFKLDLQTIVSLTGEGAHSYDEETANELSRASALCSTKGRTDSFMTLVSLCINCKKSLSLVVALQALIPVLGFVILTLMLIFLPSTPIKATTIFLYEVFWLLVSVILPKFRQ